MAIVALRILLFTNQVLALNLDVNNQRKITMFSYLSNG